MSAARRPVVGVMGSGTIGHEELAEPLGRWLAERGVHLLTGGGGGVMRSVSRAFSEAAGRAGVVIGVLPGTPPPDGYPNGWIEVAIHTHLPLSGVRGTDPMSRNHINVLSSDVIVALPGSSGTSSEVKLALAYDRPVVAFVPSRAAIPNLPPEVPAHSSLDAVGRFIEGHLGEAGLDRGRA